MRRCQPKPNKSIEVGMLIMAVACTLGVIHEHQEYLKNIHNPSFIGRMTHDIAQAVEYDKPDQLVKQMYHESSGRIDAVSHDKKTGKPIAYGVAQFIPSTAKANGVDVWDPRSSLIGMARYMKRLVAKYGGDHRKALIAYNCGEGCVNSKTLPKETQDYICKIGGYCQGGKHRAG